LFLFCILIGYYGWKHRPFEALNAVLVVVLHPRASASCCSGIVTIVIAITPINARAATIAIIANVASFILKVGKEPIL
jgi:hypothetical protein